MQTFIDKFNEITDNKFDYLKLKNGQYILDESVLVITLTYPETREYEVMGAREIIENAAKKVFGADVPNLEIKLRKSHFDREFFLKDMKVFLKQFPMLYSMLSDDAITTEISDDKITVIFRLSEAICNYCREKSAGSKIDTYLKNNYCENIALKFVNAEDDISGSIEDFEREMEDEKSKFTLDNVSLGRVIQPQNVEEFIGKIIYDKAKYIEDVCKVSDSEVLCGQVVGLKECSKKDDPSRKFYKFMLKDFTREIGCLYFPSESTKNQITLLKEGKEIVARGKVMEDNYRKGSFTFWLKDISFCTLPKDFKVNRLRRRVDDEYHIVFPQPHVEVKQANLFDIVEREPVPEFLKGKTFCVFDLETTGFAPENDKIIEIGAVRIVDGVLTDTFNTYVDPKMPIPEKITSLTGIRDSDVIGQPVIDDVMPDFYKYSDNTILVGQNVQFDYGFISVNGARQNIYFENEMMDTLVLAKKYVPGLKKYKLSYLTSYFQVENISAHRGIYDALATAEVFIKLVKMM